MNRAGYISKLCRICCDQKLDNLIFLLDAENQKILKQLHACADVTVSTTERYGML